jgi:hypothetical protein
MAHGMHSRGAARDARRFPHTFSGDPMLLTLAIILFVVWALGFLAFHVTVAIIHLLIVLAVIALVMHFVRGRKTVV